MVIIRAKNAWMHNQCCDDDAICSIKPLQKHEKGTHAHIHSKKMNSLLLDSNLSVEEHAWTTCLDILLCREEVRLTLVKLDGPISSWHNANNSRMVIVNRDCGIKISTFLLNKKEKQNWNSSHHLLFFLLLIAHLICSSMWYIMQRNTWVSFLTIQWWLQVCELLNLTITHMIDAFTGRASWTKKFAVV